MNRVIKIIIALFACIVVVFLMAYLLKFNRNGSDLKEIELKTNKETIYDLFYNFPECKNLYFISENLYSERDIGPSIYQIEILAELTDDAYNNLISEFELSDTNNIKTKINPNNINYDWKSVKNINVIESKNSEVALIKNIYLDKNKKTIYIIAIGGN